MDESVLGTAARMDCIEWPVLCAEGGKKIDPVVSGRKGTFKAIARASRGSVDGRDASTFRSA